MNPVIRHSEVRDARALQGIYSQVETIMGTLQVPFPAEESWKRPLEAAADDPYPSARGVAVMMWTRPG